MALAEILRQLSIDTAMWLLVTTLMQLYNEKDQVAQRAIQNVQFWERGSTRKGGIGAKSCVQGDKKFKEKSDTKWNKGSAASGQDPTNLSTSEK